MRRRSLLAGLFVAVLLLPLRRSGSALDLLSIVSVGVVVAALFHVFDEDDDGAD